MVVLIALRSHLSDDSWICGMPSGYASCQLTHRHVGKSPVGGVGVGLLLWHSLETGVYLLDSVPFDTFKVF